MRFFSWWVLALFVSCTPGVAALDDGGDSGDAGTLVTDAGGVDAGPVDASVFDSGAPDASVDAGLSDAGASDAGAPDAGDMDAGPTDAGTRDAGSTDAGAPDAGPDAGSADASVVDAGAEPALLTLGFTESDAGLMNPERGFYKTIDLTSTSAFSSVRGNGMTLALAGVRLDAFRNGPIDATTLTALSNGFARARTAGIKVILRFQYNDGPIGSADATRTQVLAHLTQLQPILQANADVIAVMQAGFIGAWGEWHSSTNSLDNTADRRAILTAILQALPTSRMVQVRTPHFINDIFAPDVISTTTAFTGTDLARTGHHNDCFLASDSDQGTYQSPIETWKDVVANIGRFTPIGGETCGLDPPRSECANATTEMARLHYRFLNSEYDLDVLNSWVTGGCMPEVQRRLGYRFVLQSAEHSSTVKPGGLLRLRLALRNDGYGALYNARPLQVVLDSGSTRLTATLASVDLRRWETGPHTLDVRLRVPANIAPGTWRLSLAMPDADPTLATRADYAIQLANQNVWNATLGTNVVQPALTISTTAPGVSDPTATQFVEVP